MIVASNQPKKALNESILEAVGVSRKLMTPAEKLKLARQHKRKASVSTARSVASTIEANILPYPPPSPPHVADEKCPSPLALLKL